MQFMNFILKTFHDCTKLPVEVLDKNFSIIENETEFNYLRSDLCNEELLQEIKNSYIRRDSSDPYLYTYNENEFIVFPYTFNLINSVYFIVGPFSTNKSNVSPDVPMLEKPSIKYIEKLLQFLLHDSSPKSYHPCVAKSIQYIHHNYASQISIDTVCQKLNINKCYFCNLFKKQTGYTFINFLTFMRIERSKLLIKNSNLGLTDIALSVGFNTPCYFSTIFKKVTGKTPSEYRSLSKEVK